MTIELVRRTPEERLDWLTLQVAVLTARVGALERARLVDRGPMDGTRLNQAAETLDRLADEVEEFTTTASDRAGEVAQRVRDVGAQLREFATTMDDEGA